MTRRQRLTTVLAVAGWIAAMTCVVAGLALRVINPVPVIENLFELDTIGMVAIAGLGVTWATVGALLMVRRPENIVGRWVLLIGMGHSVSVLAVAIASGALAQGAAGLEVARWAGWLAGLASLLGSGVFYLAVIFPTGHGHTPRWDLAGRVFIVCNWLTIVFLVAQPGPLHLFPGLDNPLGVGPDIGLLLGDRVGPTVVLRAVFAFGPFVVFSMASRYRAAGPIERLQLRWFVSAVVLTFASLAVAGIAGVEGDALGGATLVAFGVAGSTVPVAIGIAILRYHLYDIDRLISRTLSWAIVTGVLFAAFLGALILLQAALARFTEGQTVAVAASTLVAFALFQPVRRRVQAAIDRRFDRTAYDQERVVAAFGDSLRHEVDLETLSAEIRQAASETVRPATSALWLRIVPDRPAAARPVTMSGRSTGRMTP